MEGAGFCSPGFLGVPNPAELKDEPPGSPAPGPDPKKDPPELSSAPPKNAPDPDSLELLHPNMLKSTGPGWGTSLSALEGDSPPKLLKKLILLSVVMDFSLQLVFTSKPLYYYHPIVSYSTETLILAIAI